MRHVMMCFSCLVLAMLLLCTGCSKKSVLTEIEYIKSINAQLGKDSVTALTEQKESDEKRTYAISKVLSIQNLFDPSSENLFSTSLVLLSEDKTAEDTEAFQYFVLNIIEVLQPQISIEDLNYIYNTLRIVDLTGDKHREVAYNGTNYVFDIADDQIVMTATILSQVETDVTKE